MSSVRRSHVRRRRIGRQADALTDRNRRPLLVTHRVTSRSGIGTGKEAPTLNPNHKEAGAREIGQRIERLLGELRAADESLAEKAEELVGLLIRMYGDGLERIIGGLDPDFVRVLAGDGVVAGLLALHDLHPDDVETRVAQALDKVRPYLGSHAGGVEYLGIDEAGQVHLRLQGSCDGCPGSSATVKMAIETALLEAAPEVTGVEVENVTNDLLQIKPLRREGAPSWISLEGPIPKAGGLLNQQVGGLQLLIAATGDNLYAYASRCPACDSLLAQGSLDGSWLLCPGCGRRYDLAAAGRGSVDHHRLGPVPLVRDNGTVRVAIPEPVA